MREFQLVKKASHIRAYAPGKLDNGNQVGYGFGWETMRYPSGALCVWHSGGWSGTATYIARWIDDDFTVIVLSNDEHARVGAWGDKIGEFMRK